MPAPYRPEPIRSLLLMFGIRVRRVLFPFHNQDENNSGFRS